MSYSTPGYWIPGYAVDDVVAPQPQPSTLRRYASPLRYLERYGWAEGTQMLADEQGLLTEQLLHDVVAGAWTGSPTAGERAAAAAALERLERQLTVSSNFMDGYLRAVVALPLAAGDVNATTLEDCCLALARCGLADDSDNATERADATCKTWREWLRDVAAGKVQLVGADADATPQVPTLDRVRVGTARSGYDWATFGRR